MKRKCAEQAYELIKEGMTIGLGAGETIEYLIEFINMGTTNVKVVSPSMKTALLCKRHGIEVIPTWLCEHIDIAFDGCNQIDKSLQCIKTLGALHTQEKMIGAMADQYIILADENKFVEQVDFQVPLAVEILKDGFSYVLKTLFDMGLRAKARITNDKDGYVITDGGNLIVDVDFQSVKDPIETNKAICNILGVIDTSLFCDQVTKALIAKVDGSVITIQK
ncbi:ribose 5-phosphate isomerase A [Dubosiella newyorkensis]|uniref:Ribose 5-phosphate isomerase A n=2 Tax=Dubosiella newyorkensis TaxID=1862672 RepID=A0A1U7NQ79_9FIRM|nr:ribose 5-phosphate isomerase A [Dubosiella newyorkensis]OLU47788.1 ribose 5-phosphate isomerase A [Dubosiella newyorkensis]